MRTRRPGTTAHCSEKQRNSPPKERDYFSALIFSTGRVSATKVISCLMRKQFYTDLGLLFHSGEEKEIPVYLVAGWGRPELLLEFTQTTVPN